MCHGITCGNKAFCGSPTIRDVDHIISCYPNNLDANVVVRHLASSTIYGVRYAAWVTDCRNRHRRLRGRSPVTSTPLTVALGVPFE